MMSNDNVTIWAILKTHFQLTSKWHHLYFTIHLAILAVLQKIILDNAENLLLPSEINGLASVSVLCSSEKEAVFNLQHF